MKLPSKRLISSGAVALAIGIVVYGTNDTRQTSIASDHGNQRPSFGFRLPFEGTASAQTPGSSMTLPSDKYFKNVKAITGVPVDEFMQEMGLYSAALSMCCGDCHVGAGTDNPDWASDKNPRKIIARQMQFMVKAINKEHFGGGTTITCWTCHRGGGTPSQTASIDMVYGDPIVYPTDVMRKAPANTGVPTLDDIFAKYYKAIGGAANLAALKSYTAKGTSNLYGEVNNDPAEVFAKAPGDLSVVVHQKGGDSVRTTDGKNAWVKLPLTVVKEYPLTGSLLEGGKLDAIVAFPGEIRTHFPDANWRVSFPVTIDDKPVWVVQATGADGLLASFYFDKQTGLLTRFVRMVTTSLGRVPTQIDYSDYRPVAGVMMPFKWTYGWISGREQYVMSEYQPNAAIDAAKFSEPMLVTK